jgi:hypothetical protein
VGHHGGATHAHHAGREVDDPGCDARHLGDDDDGGPAPPTAAGSIPAPG